MLIFSPATYVRDAVVWFGSVYETGLVKLGSLPTPEKDNPPPASNSTPQVDDWKF
jgi:hypothetical protein